MISPNFSFEKRLWALDFKYIAGLDEAGRGAFAGPIVCGCVVFTAQKKPRNEELKKLKIRVDDSKKLTKLQRERAYKWIKKNALGWGVGVGQTSEINRKGISKATASGFRRAIADANNRLTSRIDYLLIDAFYIPYIRGIHMPRNKQRKDRKSGKIKNRSQQLAIIHGDARSFSIAAASIIAKVYRDRLMEKLSQQPGYKKYHWEQNKGYGTEFHQKAIKKYGTTRQHRKKFVESFLSRS